MRSLQKSLLVPSAVALSACFLMTAMAPQVSWSAQVSADSSAVVTADEDVPYGIAAGFIVGHQLLLEGNAAEALPYLHMAYRAQPEVVDIALDFQAALTAQGYFNDALEVVDEMVGQNPDSLGFLVVRAELYLKLGKTDRALTDLRALRDKGQVDFATIDTEAAILSDAGQTEQALDVYRDGLELLPDRGPDLFLGMSGVLQKAGKEESIGKLMDEGLARYPDAPRLWLVKARVQAATGDDQGALATARRADTHFAGLLVAAAADSARFESGTGEDLNPDDLPPDSFVVELADFYAQRRQLDKAVGILQPLADSGELQLAPSLWLGRLLLGTGRLEDGDALVARILERWPESGRAWFLRGKAAEARDQWDDALAHFAKAVELEPRDPEIRLGYVRAMLVAWDLDLRASAPTPAQKSRQDDFRQNLLVAATIVPDQDVEGQLVLGYGFKNLADYEQATWRFGLAAESKELRINALMQKSICHDSAGQDGKAQADLETLHREFPKHPEVANSLGYYLAEKGIELDRAAKLVETALAAEPGNGAFLDSMGWVEYRRGELEKALDYLIRSVNVLPEDPVILEHLGMVLKAQGKSVEALDVLQRALALGGDRARIEQAISELSPPDDGK